VKDGFLKVQGALEEAKVVRVGKDGSQHSWRLAHKGRKIGNVNFDIESDDIRLHWRENVYQAILVAKCDGQEDGNAPMRGLLLEKRS
jgi:hypothetical protein